jgi:DNA polymerase III subunit gamma/tau
MPSYLVLARKYRPTTFSEVVGQQHVTQTLANSILAGRVAHAFLFCGVRGVGKTTVARILAKALNCSGRAAEDADPCNKCPSCREISSGISVDVQEIDGASNTSVENIREINENIKYPPVSSPYKIIIIDEVHMISINAFNALLKTLEEPPSHAKFIFATTESHKVPATINSRCQRFNFRTISVSDIVGGMARILAQEGIAAEDSALALVAREAQGSFRDALSLLDQVIAFSPTRVTAQDVATILGISGRDSFARLMAAVLDHDAAQAITAVHELFQEGYDPEQFVLNLIHYVRNLVVVKTVPSQSRIEGLIDATASELIEMEGLAGKCHVMQLQNLFALLLRADAEIRRSSNPWIALDMTVLRMTYAPDVVDLAQLVKKLDSRMVRGFATPAAPAVREATPPAKNGLELATGHDPTPPAPVDPKPPIPEEKRGADEEGFVITGLTPLPEGTPDEVWAMLKDRLTESGLDSLLPRVMDHGKLISYGPAEVEIGFTKSFYRSDFENRLANKPPLKAIFKEFFGTAHVRFLTLAGETSLATQKPHSTAANGQTDFERALRSEAQEHPIIKAVLKEFEDSTIDFIKILPPK